MRMPRFPLSFKKTTKLIEVFAVVGATFFAGFQFHELALQLRELKLQNSADLTLRLDQEMATGVNQNILDALDSDPATPILKPPNGSGAFTVSQLDAYLSQYETLDDLYRNDLITCRMMYTEFSYDLENAYKNKNVMTEIAKERIRKNDLSLWEGFLDLGKQFDNGYHCQ